MPKTLNCDVIVAGGGLVGLTAAKALASAKREVILCAPQPASGDPRTTAVLDASVRFLEELGVWQPVADSAHPLRIMRLVDATTRMFRFRQTDFDAGEIGLEAFGYNIRNQVLADAISAELAKDDRVKFIEGSLTGLHSVPDGLTATLDTPSGKTQVETAFLVGADGRNSFVRTHFGHGEKTWSYPQTAIVLDFEHEFPSYQTSTEFHTEAGPFTVVPQSSHRAGLVWLEHPANAEKALALGQDELSRLLEEKMHSWLGKIKLCGKPYSFAMSGMIANRFGDNRHALVGEAAHVFPPIGAQGFNLGVRDIATLVSVIRRFTNVENPGERYHRERSLDINSRTYGVDLLNRTLLSGFLPAQMAKSATMLALASISPLRRQAMKSGINAIFAGN